jgi:hypothetical protein
MTVDDLAELDLAYAPPFPSANDPVNVAAFVAQSDISGFSPLETASELKAGLGTSKGDSELVLDVRNTSEYEEGHIAGSLNLPSTSCAFAWTKCPVASSSACIGAPDSGPISRCGFSINTAATSSMCRAATWPCARMEHLAWH